MIKEFMYLAGPIAGLTYREADDWREYVITHIDDRVECLSPLRYKSFLAVDERIETTPYDVHPLATDKGITRRDLFDVNRSSIILMNLLGAEHVSIGTMIELGALASDTGKLVIVVMELHGNIHDHPMVREIADYIVPTVDDAIYLVRAIA